MAQEQPPVSTEPKAPAPPPDGRDPQHRSQRQPPSLLPQALTAVCFALLVNAITGLLGRSWLVWVAVVAGGGLGIALLWQYVLPTPEFLQVLEGKLRARPGRLRGVPAPAASTRSLPDDSQTSAESARTSIAWRPIVQVLAGIAVLMLLLAFAFLQVSLPVMLVMIAILAIVVGPTVFLTRWIAARFEPVMASIASAMASIALTLGLLGVGNGIANPGALAGTWQTGSWVTVHDDPARDPLPDRLRWELAVKGGCLGQRCSYKAQAQDAEGHTILGLVILTPGADGIYRGRKTYIVDCVDRDNPENVTVANGYNDTDIYRLEPGPYVGQTKQQPTTVSIEVTHIGKPTATAKAQNCPDTFEVNRTTAERS